VLRSRTPVHRWFGAGLVAGALAFVAAEPLAAACGGFFSARAVTPEQRPSLTREKVLIVHDAARGRQHFIREVAFRRADQSFGFVVPTPTRPEVAKVDRTPFTRLRDRFPFAVPVASDGYGSGAGAGFGGRGGGAGVTVLAVERVGSFTAFVLAATDAGALAGWLKENQLVSTVETDAWLEHYVRMGFYYVAMRYDPPTGAQARKRAAIAAETIRISFDTPVAYYPYFEPETPRDLKSPRLLELWYVGTTSVVPVAQQRHASDPPRWVRPLKPGADRQGARIQALAALGPDLAALLPEGDLVVQTFQDQKRSRSGFQDILFAPAAARMLSPGQEAALAPLLGVLDHGLIAEVP
jgi:hypothetical protein